MFTYASEIAILNNSNMVWSLPNWYGQASSTSLFTHVNYSNHTNGNKSLQSILQITGIQDWSKNHFNNLEKCRIARIGSCFWLKIIIDKSVMISEWIVLKTVWQLIIIHQIVHGVPFLKIYKS